MTNKIHRRPSPADELGFVATSLTGVIHIDIPLKLTHKFQTYQHKYQHKYKQIQKHQITD